MPTIIIAIIIACYAGFVIKNKVKDMKRGKFCSCSCDDCPSKTCHTNERINNKKLESNYKREKKEL